MVRRKRSRRVAVSIAVLAVVIVTAGCVPPRQHRPIDPLVGGVAAGSQLIGCDQTEVRVIVTAPSHLDPSCTYHGGFDITASDSVLDCRGAHIEAVAGDLDRRGILVETQSTLALSNVVVRNCVVSGFNNNVRIRRQGFRTLTQGAEYENGTSAILIENSHFYDSNATGIFVDGYVTGVTLRGVEVAGSGAVGVYLEAGSKDNVIENSRIHNNGFGNVVPEGVPIVVNGTELRYESTGREGIAIDGSRDNIVRNNWIAGNSAGAIFLYKNCGEDATSQPNSHWVRHYGATGNLITGNFISTEKNGIWVGSRAAENQYFMDCSDPAYIDAALRRVHLDPASGNTVDRNSFLYVTYGVRIEDNMTTVTDNRFSSNSPGHEAVIIGTKERTGVLGLPVDGTILRDNRATITGNATPYRWVWGHTATTHADNFADQALVPLVEGTQPTINPFLFAIRIWVP